MAETTPTSAPHRGGRRRFVLLLVAIAVVVAGWSAFWWRTAATARQAVDAVLADARAGGSVVECPGERVAGYPFLLELRCDASTFAPPGGPTIAAGPLVVVGRVYAPNLLIAELGGPLTVAEDGVPLATATWSLAHASLRLEDITGTPRPGLASLAIENGTLAGAGGATAAAKLVEAHVRPTPDDASRVDVAVTATEATAAGLPPTDLRLMFAANRSALERLVAGQPLPDDGLVLDVQEASATRGETRISASGTLEVGNDGLVDGRLEITTADPAGLAALIAPLLPPDDPLPAAIAGAVAGFGRPTEIDGTKAVRVTLDIARSRVTIGLVPVGRLPRLPLPAPAS